MFQFLTFTKTYKNQWFFNNFVSQKRKSKIKNQTGIFDLSSGPSVQVKNQTCIFDFWLVFGPFAQRNINLFCDDSTRLA